MGVPGPGGVPGQGVYLVLGGYLVRYSPPPVNRMTNRCKNITLPQTLFAGGKKTCKKCDSAVKLDKGGYLPGGVPAQGGVPARGGVM